MASDTQASPHSTWTYPTRHCRLCREDIVPTVTVSNAGFPAPFRSTNITYTSEEGGRLIKPCKCKGTQRYIHEGCLAELRAKSPQKNAYLKCDLCGFEYNTKRLLVHDILLSRVARMLLTILIVVFLMFVLGFVADPIINLYVDPVDTMAGQRYWEPVKVDNLGEKADDSWWIQHFMKGLVSVGVMGFFKAVLLANPWHFWNLRHSGLLGGSTRTTTGRDRAVNISWIAVVIGVGSALYFFYQQVAKFSHSTLSKFANDVIEVQMDDDDDDLKVPQSADGVYQMLLLPRRQQVIEPPLPRQPLALMTDRLPNSRPNIPVMRRKGLALRPRPRLWGLQPHCLLYCQAPHRRARPSMYRKTPVQLAGVLPSKMLRSLGGLSTALETDYAQWGFRKAHASRQEQSSMS